MIAALAAISQRPEFLSEIAPKVEHTSEGIKIHFNMFFKGKPTTVTIDDKLPFIKPSFFEWLFGKRPTLIYARSSNDDNLYLTSLFEKAVVNLVCNNDYKNSEGIRTNFVFSLFSDCLTSYSRWFRNDSKNNFLSYLKAEIDCKSSVVMGIKPNLIYNPELFYKNGHTFVVMDYNLEYKAIMLYNPNLGRKYFSLSKNLPDSLTKKADTNKGELWITLDQLEKRRISIESLSSKNMYKSVFQVNKKLELKSYIENYFIVEFSCKVNIKEASTFMINVSIFTLNLMSVDFGVFTDDTEKREIKVKYELPFGFIPNLNKQKGEAKTIVYQKFKLQPNKYIFRLALFYKEIRVEKAELLFKIGSTSDCNFEEHIKDEI